MIAFELYGEHWNEIIKEIRKIKIPRPKRKELRILAKEIRRKNV